MTNVVSIQERLEERAMAEFAAIAFSELASIDQIYAAKARWLSLLPRVRSGMEDLAHALDALDEVLDGRGA